MRPKDEITSKVTEHAKLLVFADKFLLQPLKDLCTHKLHRDLIEYDVKVSGVAEIADLFRYVYDNTYNELEITDGSELRKLVMVFAVCKAKMLVEDCDFADLIQSGGEVARDFTRTLVKRLA